MDDHDIWNCDTVKKLCSSSNDQINNDKKVFGVWVPAGSVVTLSGTLSIQPCVLQPLIQKL